MKFLHTSDWHVGKSLKGRPRLDEHKAVLAEIVGHARAHDVDAVVIAGDIYDTAAPTAESQKLVVNTLLTLARDGFEVIAIAGNHDHGGTFEAYRPLMSAAGINLFGQARARDKGGVYSFNARSTGEPVNVAVVPFLSQRYAVRAAQLIAPGDNAPARNVGSYDQWVRNIVDHLHGGYDPDGVNLLTAHLTCTGGAMGGGERMAQSIFEYHVPTAIFPVDTHYVALGHLHRRQHLPAEAPVALLRVSARGRLRRGGERRHGAAHRGLPRDPCEGHRPAGDLRPPAAHRRRDRGAAEGHGRVLRGGLAAGAGQAVHLRRAA